jgi:hypothetical protein
MNPAIAARITTGIAVQISSSRLRALGVARAVATAVAEDEPDERALDDDEDQGREDRDPFVRLVDPLGVG